jgi:hypothetical protein
MNRKCPGNDEEYTKYHQNEMFSNTEMISQEFPQILKEENVATIKAIMR